MKSEKQTKGGRQKAKMKYNSNVKATMLIYYYTSISDEASSLAPGLPLAIFKHLDQKWLTNLRRLSL